VSGIRRFFPSDVDIGVSMSKVIAVVTGVMAWFMLPIAMVIVAFEGAREYVRECVEDL
jgi:hypothetical protein